MFEAAPAVCGLGGPFATSFGAEEDISAQHMRVESGGQVKGHLINVDRFGLRIVLKIFNIYVD